MSRVPRKLKTAFYGYNRNIKFEVFIMSKNTVADYYI